MLGKVAGNVTDFGYRRIKINGKLYLAHRIVWKILTGDDPGLSEIDHIDGNPQNNRPENLRLSDHGKNQANGPAYKNSKSGYKGVYWHKQREKWTAQIQSGKRRKQLGFYNIAEDAAMAYNEAAIVLHGEFARLNEVSKHD
jgi:hypothetical protein